MSNMHKSIYEYRHDKNNIVNTFISESTDCALHFHRALEVLYVREGDVECTVGDETFKATKDDIIFVHNYFHHRFSPIAPYKKFVVLIPYNYGNDFDSALQSITLPSHLADKDYNHEILLPIFEKLYNEYESMSNLVKKGYLNVMIGTLIEHYPELPFDKNSGINFLVKVLSYIDENYAQPITLDSLAHEFGYNKYYFSRLFNKYIGDNINNYINLVRLQHFMELSKKGDKHSVSEMAYECGFDSLTTFYRYFGKVYGESPKKYLG